MISTQRLLMIVIGINLIIGLAGSIYVNPALYDSSHLSVEQSLYEQYGSEFANDDPFSGVTNRDSLQESSIGNSLSWGKILLDIFLNGINPFSFKPNDFNTAIEQIVAQILVLFRSLMYILLIVEIIMFFKNKKSS
jgi:hypothetical protein